ncbi:hypothetical protein DTO164E3_6367 [Paecilomyces variotii]|nr:hypothetical protein DTO164E3_6367 [Paecilomyces variotii]KAJ9236328.1 hypothetical protein DTO166G5_4090 [Paecilomyces variotii]KAJ9288826.1 hypothetical protein DTO021C3_3626 [Paecilomyces variotii]KAJ9407885.1 hypothetical protein DTO045G8_4352 [Paecilomyces variotii]
MAGWMLHIFSWLLGLFQLTSAAVLPRDVTITVPDGITYSAAKHLLCVPTSWSDVASFFLGNYLSHAATVVSFPGESKYVLIMNMALAIVFPAMGAARGLVAIVRHAATISDPVQQALRSRALCMVVRSQDWKPQRDEMMHSLAYVPKELREDEDGCNGYTLLAKHAQSVTEHEKKLKKHQIQVDMKVETPPWVASAVDDVHLEVVPRHFQIFGTYHLPPGYELAYVPPTALVRTLSDIKYSLFSSYSMGSAVIAIIQIIYASVTLYRSRGNQVTQYGYASFAFTVVPYLIMSFINMLGNLVTPAYASMYMVHSEMMDEALNRGGQFQGMVGRLESAPPSSSEFAVFSGSFEQDSKSGDDGWIFKPEDAEDQLAGDSETSVIVEPKEATPKKEAPEQKNDESPEGTTTNRKSRTATWFGSIFHSNQKQSSSETDDNEKNPATRGLIICPSCYKFKETAKRSILTANHPDQYPLPGYILYRLTLLVISALPLAVIGGMSHFKAGPSSTVAQRAWTMSWLAVGSVVGGLNASHTLAKKMQFVKDARVHGHFWSKLAETIGFILILLALGAPAIGGFVVVAQMLRDYGSCQLLG